MSFFHAPKFTSFSTAILALSLAGTGCATEAADTDPEQIGTSAAALTTCPIGSLPNGTGLTVVCDSAPIPTTALNHEVHGLGSGFWGQSAFVTFPQFQGTFTDAKFQGCAAAFANFNVQKRSSSSAAWVHVTGAKVFAKPNLVIKLGKPLEMTCDAALFFPFEQGTRFTDGSDQALFQIDTGGTQVTGHMVNKVTRDLWHSPI